jgi:hypothetical protein
MWEETCGHSTPGTRNEETNKLDPEGFYSPLVIRRFSEYLHKHRKLETGEVRASDNWQSGIPRDVYMKSLWRHFLDMWLHHRGYHSVANEDLEDAICALIFNAQGYLFETLKARSYQGVGGASDMVGLGEQYTASGERLQSDGSVRDDSCSSSNTIQFMS